MWVEFALAVFAGVIVFYLPGYLVARAFSVGRFASLVIAPALSVFFSTVVGIVLEKLGVACSGPSLFGIVLACAVAVFLVGVLVSRGKGLAWQRGSVCNSEKSLKGSCRMG